MTNFLERELNMTHFAKLRDDDDDDDDHNRYLQIYID